MKIYEIHIPELALSVKFKLLPPEEVEKFVITYFDLGPQDFKKQILEKLVFNFKTEVLNAVQKMSDESAENTLNAIVNGCVMLNPGLNINQWINIAYRYKEASTQDSMPAESSNSQLDEVTETKVTVKKLTKTKFLNLDKYLKDRVIGQDEAIAALRTSLKRSQAGLSDHRRPLGVFLFAGSSGVGKTHLAKELHSYMFGTDHDIIRIDCGEFQHKHENQKILGSPNGYVGHDDGAYLPNAMMANPNTVVLFDEVEKAHPDMWDTFLRVFDEGMMTDARGNEIDFTNSIIIMTTNLGNDKVVKFLTEKGVGFGARVNTQHSVYAMPPRDQVVQETQDAIKKQFKPEFLNRIDQIVVFNHLSPENFAEIADLEIEMVDKKLAKKGYILRYDKTVLEGLVEKGVDTVKGVRGMANVRRELIEDKLADIIIDNRPPRGSVFEVTYKNGDFTIFVSKPIRKRKASKE